MPGEFLINPDVYKDNRAALGVAYDEALRLHMEDHDFEPKFEVTPGQRGFFNGTAYADDESALKKTITARVATHDTSVDATPSQEAEAVRLLDHVQSTIGPDHPDAPAIKKMRDSVQAGNARKPSEPKVLHGMDLLTEHIRRNENKDDPNSVGDNGLARGEYQMHPDAVTQANRLSGKHYTLKDRLDLKKSTEMVAILEGHQVELGVTDPVELVGRHRRPAGTPGKTISEQEAQEKYLLKAKTGFSPEEIEELRKWAKHMYEDYRNKHK